MKCARVQDLLKSDYLDAQLDKKLRLRVDGHLEKCPSCQELKKGLREQRISLRAIKQKEVPPEIWQNIQNAIIEEQLKEPANIFEVAREILKRAFSIPRPAFALAGALAVMVLAFVLGQMILGSRNPLIATTAEDVLAEYRINGDTYTQNFGTSIEEYFL